jgi:hypothetical protein
MPICVTLKDKEVAMFFPAGCWFEKNHVVIFE